MFNDKKTTVTRVVLIRAFSLREGRFTRIVFRFDAFLSFTRDEARAGERKISADDFHGVT